MEDKIKIYIPKRIAEILNKDMELFEFYKKDHSLNRNDFLNTLIVNYYEDYRQKQDMFYRETEKILEEAYIKKEEKLVCTEKLTRLYARRPEYSGEKNTATLSLKPTRYSSSVIAYIQSTLNNMSFSEYFRSILESYVSMPQDEREKIIFKQEFETIRKAVREHRRLSCATYRRPDRFFTISPYKIASSKEELFNYLLCTGEDRVFTLRISRLKTIVILKEPAVITAEQANLLDKMEKYGPQFLIRKDTETAVRLSDEGVRMYDVMYIHRPQAERIEDHTYYFNCSEYQILQYFKRFGKDAQILYPEELKNEMIRFYREGLKSYQE